MKNRIRFLQTVNASFAGKVREEKLDGRLYLVAPITMIKEGVLAGSRGPVLYTNQSVNRDVERWNDMPIVLGHPEDERGNKISARSPDILNKYGLGRIFHTRFSDGLKAESWFDVQKTEDVAPAILANLRAGKPIEMSTGLFTKTFNRRGEFEGKSYDRELSEYQPDHLAILLNERGACSIADGCGVLVNSLKDAEGALTKELELLVNEYEAADTAVTFSEWFASRPEPTANKKDCGCGCGGTNTNAQGECQGKPKKKKSKTPPQFLSTHKEVPDFQPTANRFEFIANSMTAHAKGGKGKGKAGGVWRTTDGGARVFISGGSVRAGGPSGKVVGGKAVGGDAKAKKEGFKDAKDKAAFEAASKRTDARTKADTKAKKEGFKGSADKAAFEAASKRTDAKKPADLPKTKSKVSIQQASKALADQGMTLGSPKTDLKTKTTSYEVTAKDGTKSRKTTDEIKQMIYSPQASTPSKPAAASPKASSLSSKEKDAVTEYTTRDYQKINADLRSGKAPSKATALVDSAISKSATTEPKTVFRAANIPGLAEALSKNGGAGHVFKDEGYTSTSGDKTKAENFNRGEGSRMLKINIPKGAKALDVGDLAGGLKGEKEVLLPRGSSFKVKGVQKVKEKVPYRDLKGKIKHRTKVVEYVELDLVMNQHVEFQPTSNAGANCGIGSGGFQPGNKCQKGGGSSGKAVDLSETRTASKKSAAIYSDKASAERFVARVTKSGSWNNVKGSAQIREVPKKFGTEYHIDFTAAAPSSTNKPTGAKVKKSTQLPAAALEKRGMSLHKEKGMFIVKDKKGGTVASSLYKDNAVASAISSKKPNVPDVVGVVGGKPPAAKPGWQVGQQTPEKRKQATFSDGPGKASKYDLKPIGMDVGVPAKKTKKPKPDIPDIVGFLNK